MSASMEQPQIELTPWPAAEAELYRAAGYWTGDDLGSILSRGAQAFGDRTAVIAGERSWTYGDLNARADQLASGLNTLGITPGSKVVVQLPNIGEFIEVIFALFRLGAAPIMALPTHRYAEISYFCEFADAVAYIAPAKSGGFDYRDIGGKLKDERLVQHVIIAGDAGDFVPLDGLYQAPGALPEIDPSAIALMQLSGGTTGMSKLIPRTHDDYLYSVRASAEICELSPQTVYLSVLPAAHNFPLSSPGVLGVLYAGGTVVLSESGAPDIAFPLIARHRVTMTAMVPPLALAWMTACDNLKNAGSPPDLSSLQVLQVGGAKFTEEAARRVTPVLGCKLQQVFGMAEGLVNYTRLDDDIDTVVTTQGRPISPADEVRIVDEDDQPVAPGATGLLLTRGPYTIRGYFKAAEHNAKSFTADGFYRTGDVVRLTDAGYLVVEGRAKDQINRGGEKVAADELENHLLAHPLVHDAAVVAMPDPYLGERTCAYVIPQTHAAAPGQRPRPQDLLKFLRERDLAVFKIPDRIEFVDAFPKTRLGKVDKKALRQMIADKIAPPTMA
ncbi:(2,3-dihydroxybenzoyl)adenylate synthase [Hahella sp. CR1]|uniref:(2,3-dihydroxybenzoyl)adenylate synthase n=1 Tax=Hahella sp. CR1 TaxID=2992807 RepID=UPI002441D0B5|nr:(2,3-dihydroxybenzoyl)adenylate synthase [Hahella sp. CR1]